MLPNRHHRLRHNLPSYKHGNQFLYRCRLYRRSSRPKGQVRVYSQTWKSTVHMNIKKADGASSLNLWGRVHAMVSASRELIWIMRLSDEAWWNTSYPARLLLDNHSAIRWAAEERSSSRRAEHIDAKVHFIQDLPRAKNIEVEYVLANSVMLTCWSSH